MSQHRGRLAGFIIDCQATTDLDDAACFWSQVLGRAITPSDASEDAGYVVLEDVAGEPHIELQRVTHEPRVHLDIAADDVTAEVDRLEKLGARRVESVRDWWVMEAPSGHRFCVVPSD